MNQQLAIHFNGTHYVSPPPNGIRAVDRPCSALPPIRQPYILKQNVDSDASNLMPRVELGRSLAIAAVLQWYMTSCCSCGKGQILHLSSRAETTVPINSQF